MNTKAILGAVVAVFAITLILPAMSVPDITTISSASAGQNGNAIKLSTTVPNDIKANAIATLEDDPLNAVFGYGWVDASDTGKGVVAVIHPTFRDSTQNPDSWHTHPVTLGGGNLFAFCIDAIGQGTEGSQAGISFTDSDKEDEVKNDTINVSISAKQAGVNASDLDTAASFTVKADLACPTGLGVDIEDTEDL